MPHDLVSIVDKKKKKMEMENNKRVCRESLAVYYAAAFRSALIAMYICVIAV